MDTHIFVLWFELKSNVVQIVLVLAFAMPPSFFFFFKDLFLYVIFFLNNCLFSFTARWSRVILYFLCASWESEVHCLPS
jgi:hypothetical protein